MKILPLVLEIKEVIITRWVIKNKIITIISD